MFSSSSETLGAGLYIDGKNQDEEKVGNLFTDRMLQCLGSILSQLLRTCVVTGLINVLSPSLVGGLLLPGGGVTRYRQYGNN